MTAAYIPPSSFDDLKDLPRVAHADNGFVPKDRGHPALKQYRKDDKTYSLAEVVARANARIEGELPPIKGGLDDKNPALYGSGSLGGVGKMKVAQRGAVTEDEIDAIESGRKVEKPIEPPPSIEERSKPELLPDDPTAQPMMQPIPIISSTEEILHGRKRRKQAAQQPAQIVERIIEKPVEKIVEKIVEVEKPSPLSKFVERRTRVQIATQETMFSVPAITIVRSMYGLVVILPLSDDSVTFIPRTGSRVKLSSKEIGTYNATYTGVSFELEELGIMGLCFLVPDGTTNKEQKGTEER